jgi:DNA invertase Pin-like site-specific DNA recombinase
MYIRMSTELQVESPENQERAICTYAAEYGIEIVKIYADLGVSGINTEKREQFQTLIDDVEQGRNPFNIVLYLDESRWGRFVDSRETDYHRMRLGRKNVVCQFCEKPLTLTSNIADRITEILDRQAGFMTGFGRRCLQFTRKETSRSFSMLRQKCFWPRQEKTSIALTWQK